MFQTKPVLFEQVEDRIRVTYYEDSEGVTFTKDFDEVLIATGRVSNVEKLGLQNAGVECEHAGIKVNEYLQTKNPDIFAVGDCLPGHKFTHNSDIHARYVVRNAMLNWQEDRSKIILPYATYTDPEIATVGHNEISLKQEKIEYETYTKFFDRCDRALCESKRGIYKVHCRKGTDEILGATLVGGPAGDMICQITQAMTHGLGLEALGNQIYPYPSFSESFGHMSNYGFKPKYKKLTIAKDKK